MKMKKFFAGILAAVMSIASIAMPLSTAIAAEDTGSPKTDSHPTTGIININHAAPEGTGEYKAYPIFVGDVEPEENDGKLTGRLVIDTPLFHPNMETSFTSEKVVKKQDGLKYGLADYVHSVSSINGKSFAQLMKTYDSKATFSSSGLSGDLTKNKSAADALANLLNLTLSSASTPINTDILGNNGAAFYSAFAEAARILMVDNVTNVDATEADKTLTDVKTGVYSETDKTKVTITVEKPGYYLIEYTPNTIGDHNETPKTVRRALVLVGLGDACEATINSKDTQNIASVDIQFNETMLIKNETKDESGSITDISYSYNGTEGTWAKNVSAGTGDYVNCRVVVTLPGNIAAYDQYYLAVPIMYGYNVTSGFDSVNSLERVGTPKIYLKKITTDSDGKTTTETAVVEGDLYEKNKTTLTDLVDKSYIIADDASKSQTGKEADDFKAKETFVIKDLISLVTGEDRTIKDEVADADIYSLVFEFPVKFDRFGENKDSNKDAILSSGAATGHSSLGHNGGNYADDLLMKNYISAKLVYSNNPNLKALEKDVNGNYYTTGEKAPYVKGTNDDGVKFYLDTVNKAPGTLQNPVYITKDHVTANIVTYRLRVHATTKDLVGVSQACGIEGARFAIKNKDGKYAVVFKDASARQTYDEVTGESLRQSGSAQSSLGNVWVYRISGWVDPADTDGEGATWEKNSDGSYIVPDTSTLQTYQVLNEFGWANNNTGRFEVVGIAPGDYTVVALDKTIKAFSYYSNATITASSDLTVYKLPNENNKSKTDYRFSFNPTLDQTIKKQNYDTHYAPIEDGGTIVTSEMITNYNLKWYDMAGKEITENDADWWLGQREDVGLMSMRVTYVREGITLPVTGGIGTLIFFAVGGALVVISTVAIVTKFRIKREQL